jgi:hypothetical protein
MEAHSLGSYSTIIYHEAKTQYFHYIMHKFPIIDRSPNGKNRDRYQMPSSMHVFRRFHIIPPIQIEQRSIPTNLPSKKSTGNLFLQVSHLEQPNSGRPRSLPKNPGKSEQMNLLIQSVRRRRRVRVHRRRPLRVTYQYQRAGEAPVRRTPRPAGLGRIR